MPEHASRRAREHRAGDDAGVRTQAPVPGKRTLVGAHAAPASGPGKRTLVEQAYASPVQQRASNAADERTTHAAAARGVATPSTALPYGDIIQRAFGRHDLSGVQAHTGGEAAASARAMGADAYATGHHVVLGRGTDLFTVAHEAAHVVQQRAGVHLRGGVGTAGDAHERHADAVAERVVQGGSAEALLDQYTGADRSACNSSNGSGSTIQRYESVQLDGHEWRLSEHAGMLAPAAMTHELYARENMIRAADEQLASIESFIQITPSKALPSDLAAAELAKKYGLFQVLASLRETGKPTVNTQQNDRLFDENTRAKKSEYDPRESTLKTFSDCHQCARLIMGINHPTRREKPVISPGGEDRAFVSQGNDAFEDGGFVRGGSSITEVESGGLTAINQGLLRYLGSGRLEEFVKQAGNDNLVVQQVEKFREQSNGIAWDRPAEAWRVLHDLQRNAPEVYADFATWAGIDARAMPKIGEALVTFRTQGTHGRALTRSPQTVASVAAAYGEDMVAQVQVGTLEALDPRLYQAIIDAIGKERAQTMKLGEIQMSEIAKGTDVERLRKKLLKQALQAFQAKAGMQHDFLRENEITEETPYAKLVAHDEKHHVTREENEIVTVVKDEQPKLHKGLERKELWNKHWGGVILTDGTDYATLENDASTKEPSTKGKKNDTAGRNTGGTVNAQWRYQIYGSARQGQSFHEQMMATGDFGTFAATLRYRNGMGGGQEVTAPPAQLSKDEVLAVQEIHDSVPWVSDDGGQASSIMRKLGWTERGVSVRVAVEKLVKDIRTVRRDELVRLVVEEGRKSEIAQLKGSAKLKAIFQNLKQAFATIGINSPIWANSWIKKGLALIPSNESQQEPKLQEHKQVEDRKSTEHKQVQEPKIEEHKQLEELKSSEHKQVDEPKLQEPKVEEHKQVQEPKVEEHKQVQEPKSECKQVEVSTSSGPGLPSHWRQGYLDQRVRGHFGGAWYAIAVIQALDHYRRFEGQGAQSGRQHAQRIVDACEQFLQCERDSRNEIPDREDRMQVVSELLSAARCAL